MKKIRTLVGNILIIILVLFFVLFFGNVANANNISVSNVKISGQDITQHCVFIELDIAWENSWRVSSGPSNWDAAWVFIKFRLRNSTIWNHASLNWVDGSGTADGHTVPVNCVISSSNDDGNGNSKGVYVYGSSEFTQTAVSYNGIKLLWNYGYDGVSDSDSVEVCVLAIEMVYVPQGSFQLGSGGTESSAFYEYPSTSNPYTIINENAINIGSVNGNLFYPFSVNGGDQTGVLNASFPKGYNAFYCMKYEITQEQYVVFLNKLTAMQDNNRFVAYYGFYRYAIAGAFGNRYSDNPYVAANYLCWADIAAYLDWAALRPMTELEFEKACRGPVSPVANEYAWGTNSVAGNPYTISNSGASNEEIASNYSIGSGNAIYSTTKVAAANGPLRVGIYSSNVLNSGRITAGASYYGIMELSGNLSESTITIGNASGRAYTGLHGDGNLSFSGDANVSNWPSSATGFGVGFRGGNWFHSSGSMRTSDRWIASFTTSGRNSIYAGRGVRTAP